MTIQIPNSQALGNIVSAVRSFITRHTKNTTTPKEWEGILARIEEFYQQNFQSSFPVTYTDDHKDAKWIFSEAIDESFIGNGYKHLAYPDPEDYLAEDDDMNRIYDSITGRYSRNYRRSLSH